MREAVVTIGLTILLCLGVVGQEKNAKVIWAKDLASAQAIAEKESKLLLIYFYGEIGDKGDARKHHRGIDEVFGASDVKEAAREYIAVRVSCHTWPDEARKYGISRGPLVVVREPGGKDLARSLQTDATCLSGFLAIFAADYRPKPVDWKGTPAAAEDQARSFSGLVLVAAYEDGCKTCDQAQAMLLDRRLVLPRRRLACLRLEKKRDADAIKELGVGTYPHLLLIKPGRTADEPHTVVHKKLWPSNARALAERIDIEFKALDR